MLAAVKKQGSMLETLAASHVSGKREFLSASLTCDRLVLAGISQAVRLVDWLCCCDSISRASIPWSPTLISELSAEVEEFASEALRGDREVVESAVRTVCLVWGLWHWLRTSQDPKKGYTDGQLGPKRAESFRWGFMSTTLEAVPTSNS